MKEVYLVRHGDTDATEKEYFAGLSNIPLTPRGRKRILKLREFLEGRKFDRVFVSPLRRTVETALLLVDALVPLDVCEELKERSFGKWEGKGFRDIGLDFPEELREWEKDPLRFTPPGGESFERVLERVAHFWERLKTMGEGRYLVVTHAGVLRCFFVHLLKMRFEQTFSFLFDPGVLVIVHERDDFPQVVQIMNFEVEE